ncbi:unnamed protein product, partial [Cuscuta campestris]
IFNKSITLDIDSEISGETSSGPRSIFHYLAFRLGVTPQDNYLGRNIVPTDEPGSQLLVWCWANNITTTGPRHLFTILVIG